MIVLKFGGSSLSSLKKIKKIANLVCEQSKKQKVIVVVSAMGKTTNNLINMAGQVIKTPNLKLLDGFLNLGELTSVYLLGLSLCEYGVNVNCYNGGEFILTSGEHGNSFISKIYCNKILEELKKYDVLVVAGFCGENMNNEITTLGRGGSDTTAVAIASSLKCSCKIYTDVDGVFSIDPKVFEDAKKLNSVNIEDMLELSAFGAKVIDTRSLEIAKKFKTTLTILNSNNKTEGTKIVSENFENLQISGLALLQGYSLVKMSILNTELQKSINLLSKFTTKLLNLQIYKGRLISIMLAVESVKLPILKQNFTTLEVTNDIDLITIVGVGFCTHQNDIQNILGILNNNYVYVSLCERVLNIYVKSDLSKNLLKTLAQNLNL